MDSRQASTCAGACPPTAHLLSLDLRRVSLPLPRRSLPFFPLCRRRWLRSSAGDSCPSATRQPEGQACNWGHAHPPNGPRRRAAGFNSPGRQRQRRTIRAQLPALPGVGAAAPAHAWRGVGGAIDLRDAQVAVQVVPRLRCRAAGRGQVGRACCLAGRCRAIPLRRFGR